MTRLSDRWIPRLVLSAFHAPFRLIGVPRSRFIPRLLGLRLYLYFWNRYHDWEWGHEDYELHWNYADFSGMRVLDIGADWGSSAQFFLDRGAREVIAVDGEIRYYRRMLRECKGRPIKPIHLMIKGAEDFSKLLKHFNPDIVKIDIEGAEKHLLQVPKYLIEKIDVWLIETHSMETTEALKTFFGSSGFHVQLIMEWGVGHILLANRARLETPVR